MEWQLLVGEQIPKDMLRGAQDLCAQQLEGRCQRPVRDNQTEWGFLTPEAGPRCGGMRQMGKTFSKTDHHAPGQLPPVCMRVPYH